MKSKEEWREDVKTIENATKMLDSYRAMVAAITAHILKHPGCTCTDDIVTTHNRTVAKYEHTKTQR